MQPNRATPRPSAELHAKIRLAQPWLATVTQRFWGHPALAEVFPQFLVRLYWSSLGSVRAIRSAERACRAGEPDELRRRLAAYYEKHYRDEAAHPAWLLADLPAVGLDPDAVRRGTPPASVAPLVGSQLFWIDNAHPIALLGHFFVLEGYPPSEPHLRGVIQRTGLPGDAFRMMIAHAHIDPSHSEELDELLDELRPSPELLSLVGLSALTTLEHLGALYRELLELADAALPAA